jgi:putative ABC transport system ATP-binding protein
MNEVVYALREVVITRTKGGVSFTLRVPELHIHQGEFIAVVGPSGCGKSTLLDLLALVLKPSSSESFSINVSNDRGYEEREIPRLLENEAARIRRKNIGYVLQNGGLFPFLNVRENILLTAQISGVKVAPADFQSLIGILGLEGQLSKKPQHLSGGQRQRVAVARALIHKPEIILADEPTAAVDYPTALDIRDELKDLAHKVGAAVVIVTHDHSLVKGIADAEVHFEVTRKARNETLAVTSVIPGNSSQAPADATQEESA